VMSKEEASGMSILYVSWFTVQGSRFTVQGSNPRTGNREPLNLEP